MSSESKLDVFLKISKYIINAEYLHTKLVNLLFKPIRIQKPCGGLGKSLVVYPDGNIYLYHSLDNEELTVGNISSVLDSWNKLINENKILEIFNVEFIVKM